MRMECHEVAQKAWRSGGRLWLPWRSFLPVSFPTSSPGRELSRFLSPDVGSASMLLLSLDEDTLFVGARGAVIALDAGQPGAMETKRKLDWIPSSKDLDDCSMKGKNMTDWPNFIRVLQFLNSTHLYTCATFAFSPRCTYIWLPDWRRHPSPTHDGLHSCSGRKLKGTQIYLNEHLTKRNADIARTARFLTKQKKIQSTWTANCKVFIKLNGALEVAKVLLIRDIEELDKYRCDTPQCAVPSPGTSLPSQERARARAQHRQQREAGRLRMRSSQEDSPPQTTRRGALALNRGKYGSVLLSPLAAFVNCE
ncbi:hypothetical protein AAFF_G00429450 [Aldrovandia affinis]|uniref:Sema domain-containing protein n=1 Tax=Aldrovandia affinis TaxID=143900 RepID=A0AAD7R316_9TELE|nr:hypothetical protein AAFF_G00429450 [Aldrovandia affinis]